MAEWLPIETAPRDGTYIILWMPEYSMPRIGSFRMDDGFSGDKSPLWLDDSYDEYSCGYASTPLTPTHWMPLPEPPTGRGGGED